MTPNLRRTAASTARRTKSRRGNDDTTGSDESSTTTLEQYIPSYLAPWVHFYHGDFCYSHTFHPKLIAQLFAEGFLPIATAQGRILLPKLHAERCVMPLRPNSIQSESSLPSPSSPSQPLLPLRPTHVSKSVRKKANRFRFTLNQRFQQVVQGCRTQHGEHCWLYPNLVDAFLQIHRNPIPAKIADCDRTCLIQLVSVEVWDAQTLQLVAGELGYTVGTMYTSLTGFSAVDSAGSVQLAVTGRLLQAAGFVWWDLGMAMPYKHALGATIMPRDSFVQAVHACRLESPRDMTWMDTFSIDIAATNEENHNCRKILDRTANALETNTDYAT